MTLKTFLFENKTRRQTIVKNTFWLFFGNITSRLIRAGLLIYAARILGATEWGLFSYALSIAALFTVFTDFGMNAVITRESSKDLSVQEKYFSTAIVIKGIISLFVMILMFLAIPLISKNPSIKIILPIIIILTILDSFRDFGASLSRALEKMEIEGFIQIFTNIAIFIGGFIALYYSASAYSLSIGYIIGVGAGTIAAFYPFRQYLKSFKNKFDPLIIKKTLYASWPIGMVGIMSSVMLNTDSVMIEYFKSLTDVGLYSAGQRIAFLIYIIPSLIITAMFPSFAKIAKDRERFKEIIEKSLSLLLMISLPLSLGGALLSKEIILTIFGNEYLGGSNAFLIMNLTYVTSFLSVTLGMALFALNKEKNLITYSLLGITGNFVFNLILIPYLGISGAALSTLLNQIIICSYLYFIIKKEIKISIIAKTIRIAGASILMVISILLITALNSSLYLTIPIAIAIYTAILYILKEPILLEIIKPVVKKLN